jgi:hypothetical protein
MHGDAVPYPFWIKFFFSSFLVFSQWIVLVWLWVWACLVKSRKQSLCVLLLILLLSLLLILHLSKIHDDLPALVKGRRG